MVLVRVTEANVSGFVMITENNKIKYKNPVFLIILNPLFYPIEISSEPSMKNDASLLIKLMIIANCLIVSCRKLEACVTVRDGLLFGS